MLKRMGVNSDYLWGQAGLFVKEMEELEITPYYRNMKEEVTNFHGIQYCEHIIQEPEDFRRELLDQLKTGGTASLNVDIFEMPYCIYFRQKHHIHDVEIIRVEQNTYTICDHYYHYFGQVDETVIVKAVESCLNNLRDLCRMYYFKLNRPNGFQYTTSDLFRVVTENYHVMKGTPIELLIHDADGADIGLAAIDSIQSKISDMAKMDAQGRADHASRMYIQVKEVSNSRHHFHVFLKAFSENELAESYADASHQWAVLTNMIIRAPIVENLGDMISRINKRLEKVAWKEKENCRALGVLLESLLYRHGG
jgi:hypothetical protein